jgi:hypothetical protein
MIGDNAAGVDVAAKLSPWSRAVKYVKTPHSPVQKFTQALFDSIPVTSFVLLLVVTHVIMMALGVENKPFEHFTTVFFIAEVAVRIWAHHLYYFFCGYTKTCMDPARWLNTMDFLIVAMDVFGLIMTFSGALDAEDSPGQYAKSGRMLRMLRMLKFVRAFRMVRLVRTFFMVLAQERGDSVMQRRKHMQLQMSGLKHLWEIDRLGGAFDPKAFPPDDASEIVKKVWTDLGSHFQRQLQAEEEAATAKAAALAARDGASGQSATKSLLSKV